MITARTAHHPAEQCLQVVFSHQQNIFEGMNIRYFGPFDGHDVKEVVRILKQLRSMKGPKLLHLHTTKGKGYEPARSVLPSGVHGQILTRKPARESLPTTATNLLSSRYLRKDPAGTCRARNPKIVGVTPGRCLGCSMNIMMKAMPNRTFNVSVSPRAMPSHSRVVWQRMV